MSNILGRAEQGSFSLYNNTTSLRERLINKKVLYMQQLTEIEEMLELLDKNPDLEKLSDLLSRVNTY